MFRDLLVIVDSSNASDNRVELAGSLAAAHDADLIGLYVLPIPEPEPSEHPALIDEIIIRCIREEQALAREGRRRFEAAVKRYGIKGEWRTAGGIASERLCLRWFLRRWRFQPEGRSWSRRSPGLQAG